MKGCYFVTFVLKNGKTQRGVVVADHIDDDNVDDVIETIESMFEECDEYAFLELDDNKCIEIHPLYA